MGKDLKGKELGTGIGQRKDGRYEARAVVNGTKIAIYNFNLNELKREFEREKERIKRSNVVHCPDVTVMEWFDAWFEQYNLRICHHSESGMKSQRKSFHKYAG